ncbi:hypothetical protein WICPIJ_007808 [Wickerhamomyces pijperi]|uniref:Uncharacterized protein n=1 Tax=Wickerhamomyces pijperi TaxID=599730 RepID=A0A9P8Q130_WICPI|nr:hypothetical protein WICPIJ_007808 [Wickerhamomyces pijperi]
MALRLSQDTINTQDVLDRIFMDDELHIEDLLCECLETVFDEGRHRWLVHWLVIEREPIRVKDRLSQRGLEINVREMGLEH